MTEAGRLVLDENRFFDPDPATRNIAKELYDGVRNLPIVCPHGHTDPRWFAENTHFPDPTALILIPDHYILRMLYSQGISLESLGIPTLEGTPVEKDHMRIWQIFADHFHIFAGTPTQVWLNHEFATVFGVEEKLTGATAMTIYDQIQEKLQSPEYLPRELYDRFNIEVLTTTDGAADTLEHHRKIADSGWDGKVIPCFRPDDVLQITGDDWRAKIDTLSEVSGNEVHDFTTFIRSLEQRREDFKSMGAVSTDMGMEIPLTVELTAGEAESIFQKALRGEATAEDGLLFTAHMLMEMARMSLEDGLVMQIHPGSFRNHNRLVADRFGPDMGGDIPVATEYTRNMHALLNRYGNDGRFTLIVFTLDESAYTRELAPLAGHYPALKLGPAWWFHDSIEGMMRYRQQITETAGIYNTVGFNDDTRAFLSIPARHDLSRRIDCTFLARLVTRHIIDLHDAEEMSRALTYDLVKRAYRLP